MAHKGFTTLHDVIKARAKEAKPSNPYLAELQKGFAPKPLFASFEVTKVSKGHYTVLAYTRSGSSTVKRFKSRPAAEEWCLLHTQE